MTTKKVTFKPPTGSVPEGTQVGDMFDLVSTFQLESGGTVCLKQMGEHKMPGYGASEGTDKGNKQHGPYRQEAADMAASAPPAPDYG